MTSPNFGSPPLAWGFGRRGEGDRLSRRFTPTRVGIWRRSLPPHPLTPVHPHSRGDLFGASGRRSGLVGSPPLAWGFECEEANTAIRERFTPTRVGIWACRRCQCRFGPVHPHSRGDLRRTADRTDGRRGSPPLAWGFESRRRYPDRLDRFTPTRVGIWPRPAAPCLAGPVHPHSRGDLRDNLICLGLRRGSPPLAWGFGADFNNSHRCARFTPTRVGICPSNFSASTSDSVHPHSRGDLRIPSSPRRRWSGSPPLAWGFAIGDLVRIRDRRFTPTRVGIWGSRGLTRIERSVHPHSRGDLVPATHVTPRPYGSPPLAWGFVHEGDVRLRDHRFTPTRVGI